MGRKARYQELPAELAEALRRMDEAYEASAAGLPSLEGDPEYVQIGLETEFVDQALRAMRADGVSRAELARRMDVSRAHVTNLLNEAGNVTLETIAKVAVALERDVAFRLIRKTEKVTVEAAQPAAGEAERFMELLRRIKSDQRIAYDEQRWTENSAKPTAKIVDLDELAA